MINRAFRLRRRPAGAPGDEDLELVEDPVPELGDGEALVRTLLLSVDPANRIWMSDMRGYQLPVPVGAVMEGIGIGEVVSSRRADLRVISGKVGLRKPDPAMFERGVEAMGLPPERIVFVDDFDENLPPARALGMTAVLHAPDDPLKTVGKLERLFDVPLRVA